MPQNMLENPEGVLKEKLRKLENAKAKFSPSKAEEMRELTTLMFRISRAVSETTYLMMLAEPGRCDPIIFGKRLDRTLASWKEVIEQMKNVLLFGTMDWTIIQSISSNIIYAAKRCGIPLTAVVRRIVESLGTEALLFLEEDTIKEVYSASEVHGFKQLLKDLGGGR